MYNLTKFHIFLNCLYFKGTSPKTENNIMTIKQLGIENIIKLSALTETRLT